VVAGERLQAGETELRPSAGLSWLLEWAHFSGLVVIPVGQVSLVLTDHRRVYIKLCEHGVDVPSKRQANVSWIFSWMATKMKRLRRHYQNKTRLI
jgi:hypothetical protein